MASRPRPAPLRPHLLARGKRADQANRFLALAWERGWLPPPALDPAELWAIAALPFGTLAEAAECAGRPAEDITDFRLRLERLCAAVANEADLNALGRAMAYGQLMRTIRNRLALGMVWRERPALLETSLAPPIIVIGHMRSGTTRIHKLLAADPAFSYTRYCDAYHPVPSRFGLNRVKSAVEIVMLQMLNPWMQSIHPMAPAAVEEELAWISGALHHSIYESQWHIPSYSRFSEARDPAPIYREFVRIFQTDAANRGNVHRPRVLKVPAFAEDLDTLLSAFPDARLVLARRDHASVLNSAISLAANQMAIQSDGSDLESIATLWQHKIALRDAKIAAALASWRGPVAHLEFASLNADWESAIRNCYTQLNLDLTPSALARMRQVMAASASGYHHGHAEQLARLMSHN